MTTCRWNGLEQARMVPQRHADACDDPEACPGCMECSEPHCVVCRRRHADVTCAECVSEVRVDLHEIATMCDALPAEAEHRGVNGEAMMLLGPAADPEAWRNRAMSAIMGRLPADYLKDARDEAHPLWVLGTWEQLWRDHLDQPTELTATLPRLVDYVDRQLHVMAEVEEVPFEDFARDLRQCRSHLEGVLRDGEQVEKGAPCPKCGRGALVKSYADHEAHDRWECRNRDCREWWTDSDYRAKVGAAYEHHADALTASALRRVHRVPEGTVRQWALRGQVRKRGRDGAGRMLYDVGDTLEMRDKTTQESA